MIRLMLSLIFGYLLGLERKLHNNHCGSRSMALLCMTSCLVSILSLTMIKQYSFDIMRLLQGTIQGFSMLGMVLIFKTDKDIDGLTTAITLFFVIILGLVIGMGLYFYAFMSFILAYLLLESKYWQQGDK